MVPGRHNRVYTPLPWYPGDIPGYIHYSHGTREAYLGIYTTVIHRPGTMGGYTTVIHRPGTTGGITLRKETSVLWEI